MQGSPLRDRERSEQSLFTKAPEKASFRKVLKGKQKTEWFDQIVLKLPLWDHERSEQSLFTSVLSGKQCIGILIMPYKSLCKFTV
jgi:hypothetical protein